MRRIPPGRYVSHAFPEGTSVIVTDDRRFLHVCKSGEVLAMSVHEEWARSFVDNEHWELDVKHKDAK